MFGCSYFGQPYLGQGAPSAGIVYNLTLTATQGTSGVLNIARTLRTTLFVSASTHASFTLLPLIPSSRRKWVVVEDLRQDIVEAEPGHVLVPLDDRTIVI